MYDRPYRADNLKNRLVLSTVLLVVSLLTTVSGKAMLMTVTVMWFVKDRAFRKLPIRARIRFVYPTWPRPLFKLPEVPHRTRSIDSPVVAC